MALAKFREDIVSRFHQATVIRAKEHDAFLTPEAEPKGAPTKLKGFAAPQSRPLPVIVLADISGSMSVNGKIDALNEALKTDPEPSVSSIPIIACVRRSKWA